MAQEISVSTHLLDSAGGGGRPGVTVEVLDEQGARLASAITDASGRIAELAAGLEPGVYQLRWALGGAFVVEASVKVALSERRHYHVPLLASAHSATVYLGA